jgi:hypothetical protein
VEVVVVVEVAVQHLLEVGEGVELLLRREVGVEEVQPLLMVVEHLLLVVGVGLQVQQEVGEGVGLYQVALTQ